MSGVHVADRGRVLDALRLFEKTRLDWVDTLLLAHTVDAVVYSFDQAMQPAGARRPGVTTPGRASWRFDAALDQSTATASVSAAARPGRSLPPRFAWAIATCCSPAALPPPPHPYPPLCGPPYIIRVQRGRGIASATAPPAVVHPVVIMTGVRQTALRVPALAPQFRPTGGDGGDAHRPIDDPAHEDHSHRPPEPR